MWRRAHLLAAAAAAAVLVCATPQRAPPPPLFACSADGVTLVVTSTPSAPPFFPYAVLDAASGAAWLEGGSVAVASSRAFFSASAPAASPGALSPQGAPELGAGADENLGAYTFLSVDWLAAAALPAPVRLTTNFTCYASVGGAPLIAFTARFPDGLMNASLLPPPPSGTTAMSSNARPLVHFPSFAAGALTALRSPATGYVEWAGCMSSGASDHGVALERFQGGQQSGPLLLFNASTLADPARGRGATQALVLGAMEAFGHAILGIVPDPAAAAPSAALPADAGTCGAGAAPHTDQLGAGHSPGYVQGAHAGSAAACCALCTNLTLAQCDSWVFDTTGTSGPDCWPCIGTSGSTPVADRILGFPAERATPCGASLPDTDAAAAVPAVGFEGGTRAGAFAACCSLCAVLGPLACEAFVYDAAAAPAPAPDCFPLLAASGTRAAPGRTLGLGAGAPRLAAGVQGYLLALPPGFSTTFALAASPRGATEAVMRFGLALRTRHRTQRVAKSNDPLRRTVSYWTDNGAYYEDDHWGPRGFFNSANHTPEIIFNGLKNYHAEVGAKVGTYQLDPWWSDGQGDTPSWYWATEWAPFSGFFPSGLAALGMPLTLYSNMYAVAPFNNMTQFDWVTSAACPIGLDHCSARVVASQSYDFHSFIMDRGLEFGMTNFEIDFINFQHLSFTDTSTDVRVFDEWWGGMAQAAAEHATPVQLCMDLPAVALASVQWGFISNARLQGDGFPDDDSRYDIFQSSLLYSAIDLAPFLDVVWTTSCQPLPDNIFKECEPHVQQLNFIAALSAGPVGFGDAIGMTNMTLLNMSSRSDGVLLQPSAPATPVEFTFLGAFNAAAGGGARIAAAPSFIPRERAAAPLSAPVFPWPPAAVAAGPWFSVIGVFVGGAAPTPVRPSDLAPPLAPAGDVVSFLSYAPLSMSLVRIAAACTDGADAFAGGCAARFSEAAPLQVSAVEVDVYSVAPVFAAADGTSDGWSLLGELGKTTRVSPTRFLSASPCAGAAGTLCVAVAGAAGEDVSVTLVAPGGGLRALALSFPPGGGGGVADVTCTGAGAAASCAVALEPPAQ